MVSFGWNVFVVWSLPYQDTDLCLCTPVLVRASGIFFPDTFIQKRSLKFQHLAIKWHREAAGLLLCRWGMKEVGTSHGRGLGARVDAPAASMEGFWLKKYRDQAKIYQGQNIFIKYHLCVGWWGCLCHESVRVPLMWCWQRLCCWQWWFFPKSVGNCLVLFLSPAVVSCSSLIADFAVTFFQSVCCQVASIVFHGHSAQGCNTRDVN